MDSNSRKNIAINICPDLADIINFDSEVSESTWQSPLTTGKYLEFLALCFLLRSFKNREYKITINRHFYENPGSFYLRNEIPHHHDAQAGHEAGLLNSIELDERFFSSLLPRVEIESASGQLLLFREGNPFHLIDKAFHKATTYKQRPDLVLISGTLDVEVTGKTVNYNYAYGDLEMTGCLSIKNQNYLPLVEHDSNFSCDIPTKYLVECSVSKSTSHANTQISDYLSLFNNTHHKINPIFVSGINVQSKYETLVIDISRLKLDSYLQDVSSLFDRQINTN